MKVYEIANDYDEELHDIKEFICGTEYEIEDVKALIAPDGTVLNVNSLAEKEPVWIGEVGFMRDNSLRNNGVEVVTAPCDYDTALSLFKKIHTDYVKVGEDAYTARTSIHVHVNVLPWTLEQLDSFVLLYALLEPVFFSRAEGRKHNIHCVPLNFTSLPVKYSAGVSHLLQMWSKYTAFNLLPIKTLGTVEFRHLHGTGDYTTYLQWLFLIKSLWTYINSRPNISRDSVKSLLEKYNTIQIAHQVLENVHYINFSNIDFSVSTIDVKLAFI
jgi:hypothetical protein